MPTASWRSRPGCRGSGRSSPRTVRWSTWPTAGPRIVGKVDAGYIFVDGSTVGDISETSLTDRRILGEEGFISVIAVVNTHASKIVSGPDIHARGFVEDDSVFDGVRPLIVAALEEALAEGVDDSLPAAAGDPPPDRQVGQRHPPPPADDHPRGDPGLRVTWSPRRAPHPYAGSAPAERVRRRRQGARSDQPRGAAVSG